jgi:sialic acid synthase SpsE
MSFHSPSLPNFSSPVVIGGKSVGPGEPCFIIAEAGSNHDRKIETAIALVDAAAEADCDAIKFQTFTGPDIAAGGSADYVKLPKQYGQWGQYLQDFYANCALPEEFHKPLFEHARDRNIMFFSSPFSEKAVDLLVDLGVIALKIASFEMVHLPLIRHAANTGLPLIISTGMAGLGDIERALEAVDDGGGGNVILLHCGSNYPLGAGSAHLAAMDTIRKNFGVPVGYSDHTLGLTIPTTAAALGANAFEKHITLDQKGNGPDHSFAISSDDLKLMVHQMREAELAVGQPQKRRQQEELEHAQRGRRSLFATRDLKKGEILTLDAVKIVRPGIGLEPMFLDILLNCPVIKDAKMDTPLCWDNFLDTGSKSN